MKEYTVTQGVKIDNDYPAHVTIQVTPQAALWLMRNIIVQLEAKADFVEIAVVGEMTQRGADVDHSTK
jgi:hypothetical protein